MSALQRWPAVLRALLAQALALLGILGLLNLGLHIPPLLVLFLQGGLAALLAHRMGLGPLWWCFQGLLPWGLAWQITHAVPTWIWPTLLLVLLLIYGGGILTRVPLYLSRRSAWEALHRILEAEGAQRVADLGAGLGNPARFLAQRAPTRFIVGIEAAPLVWFIAWIRSLGQPNLRLRFGSFWNLDLAPFDVVHAFLSPAPMSRLWAKVCSEMRPGTLFVSHTFEIPGVPWEARQPLPGRSDAALLLYRVPPRAQNQVPPPTAEG